MAGVALLGALVHHGLHFRGGGRVADAALFVEYPHQAYARLRADVGDYLRQRRPVVAQHLVARAALDDLADALGVLQHGLLGLTAVQTQVEHAEQRPEADGAEHQVQRELHGQTERRPIPISLPLNHV